MAQQQGVTLQHPNLHTAADQQSPVVRFLNPGIPLVLLDQAGDYWHVQLAGGEEGYINTQFVQVGEDVTPAPVADGFLRADPAFAAIPLAPAADQQVNGAGGVAAIWNQYGGLLAPLAERLGFDPAVAVAVLATESGGAAVGADGRMIIRFENGVFFDQWGGSHSAPFGQHFTFNAGQPWLGHQWRPDPAQAWQPCHVDQACEWAVFTFACTLDDGAAKRAISMGLTQIMGFNFATVGYATVQDMYAAFAGVDGARAQILGFFDFVQQNGGVTALRQQDYATFARLYNGSGQTELYANRIGGFITAFQALHAGA